MDLFSQQFQLVAPHLREQILISLKNNLMQAGFRSIWEKFEDIINPTLILFLKQSPFSIPDCNIKKAKSKSVYPDLKIQFDGKLYAIDIKSGEDTTDPWYDISRLDTYEDNHLKQYAAEFSIVVRWRGRENTEIVDIYIEPTYQTVGYREDSDGVLYRPYDGKLRPKPWRYFEQKKSFWGNPVKFKEGLIKSLNFRRRSYILEWYKEMNISQRESLKKDLRAIDTAKSVRTDEGLSEDEGNNNSSL